MAATKTISLRADDTFYSKVKSLADLAELRISDYIRELLYEKIEDEEDIKIYKEYIDEVESGTVEYISWSDVKAKYN